MKKTRIARAIASMMLLNGASWECRLKVLVYERTVCEICTTSLSMKWCLERYVTVMSWSKSWRQGKNAWRHANSLALHHRRLCFVFGPLSTTLRSRGSLDIKSRMSMGVDTIQSKSRKFMSRSSLWVIFWYWSSIFSRQNPRWSMPGPVDTSPLRWRLFESNAGCS